YQASFSADQNYIGHNDTGVYIETATDTLICNPSVGDEWQEMSQSDIPWEPRSWPEAVSFQGKIYIMGGLVDAMNNDVWSSVNGSNWDLETANAAWSPRDGMATVVFNNKIWLLGGQYFADYLNDPITTYSDVYSSGDGKNWTLETTAPWGDRVYHGVTVYDNKIWVTGGVNGAGTGYNDVWNSADGVNWTCVAGIDISCLNPAPAWSVRWGHDLVSFNNKLWLMAGKQSGNTYFQEVWSSADGITWILETNTPLWGTPNPSDLTEIGRAWAETLIFDDGSGEKMWLMGGSIWTGSNINTEVDYNDVYSSADGVNWTLEIDPGFKNYTLNSQPSSWTHWSARRAHAAVVHNNEMWVLGGYEFRVKSWNDVWHSPDGVNWSLIGENYGGTLHNRWLPDMIGFNNKLWVMGGLTAGGIGSLNDIWSTTDGRNWTLEVDNGLAPWAPRKGHKLLRFNNKLWLIGGCYYGSGFCQGICTGGASDGLLCRHGGECLGGTCSNSGFNDAWSSVDGVNWIQETADADFVKRSGVDMTVYDDGGGEKMWIMGGWTNGVCTGGDYPGQYCRLASHCPNGGTCSKVCTGGINRGQACNVAGECPGAACDSFILGDVWNSSDGINWTQVTAGAWPDRYHMEILAYDDGGGEKLWMMGGYDATWKNDVWYSSDGAAWTQATAAAGWTGRYGTATLAYNNKMWLISGNQPPYFLPTLWTDDVWSSTDGVNWIEVTGDAPWKGRDFFAATVYNNRMWLGYGDSNGGQNNDLWASKFGQSMSFTVSAARAPEDPAGGGAPPLAPVNLTCLALSSDTISWKFQDLAATETGFRLYGPQGLIIASGLNIVTNLDHLNEPDLLANTLYSNRYVTTFNSSGESYPTNTASCYTLANKPKQLNVLQVNDKSLVLQINKEDGNPENTEYAIYEINSEQYLQADGVLAGIEVWLSFADWGGAGGVTVIGDYDDFHNDDVVNQFKISLTPGQEYDFVIKARNGDGIETEFSQTLSVTTLSEPAPEVILSATKGVGININQTQVKNNGVIKIANAQGKYISIFHRESGLALFVKQFSWLLTILLIIFGVILVLSVYLSIKHLLHDKNKNKCFRLIWILLTRDPSHVYTNYAEQQDNGTYNLSFNKYRQLHLLSKRTLLRFLSVAAIKLIILLVLLVGILGVQYKSKAQIAPFNQDGQNAQPGDEITYIVEVINQGEITAQNLLITDVVDSNLEYVADSAVIVKDEIETSEGVVINDNLLSFAIGDLDPQKASYAIFTARVNQQTEGLVVTNQGKVAGDNFTDINTNTTSNPVVPVVYEPVCGDGVISINEQCEVVADCAADEQCENCVCVGADITEEPVPEPEPDPDIPDEPDTPDQPDTPDTPDTPDQPPGPGGEQPIPPDQPQPPEQPLIRIFDTVIKAITDNSVVKFAREKFFDNPQVEQASQNVVTPILVSVALVNTIPSAILLTTNILPYLHLVFSEPFLWFFRRKRKKWGIVFDSLTKMPVSLAVVRLYSKKDNKLVQTKVTDKDGRYLILIKDSGEYYLTVTKPGYEFPTKFLKDEKQDIKYLDLYHGNVLNITTENSVLTSNIPLDQKDKELKSNAIILRNHFIRNTRSFTAYSGTILASLVLIIFPSIITFSALMFHLILLLLFRAVLIPPKSKSWGFVFEKGTKNPLHYSIVRIFDLKFNKLLETQVTDSKGRYAFLVSKNIYQLVAEKTGYQSKEIKPINLVKKEDIVDLDIDLEKK
ncbi:hypothetical protein ACFL2U_02605, partial [Patescibacteria group bacterium]